MARIAVGILLVVIVLASVKFKMWQCEEMFPNSSLTACILWK